MPAEEIGEEPQNVTYLKKLGIIGDNQQEDIPETSERTTSKPTDGNLLSFDAHGQNVSSMFNIYPQLTQLAAGPKGTLSLLKPNTLSFHYFHSGLPRND